MKWKKYRIVKDTYCGFEVQVKYCFLPFWLQCSSTNSHVSLMCAKEFIAIRKKTIVLWVEE